MTSLFPLQALKSFSIKPRSPTGDSPLSYCIIKIFHKIQNHINKTITKTPVQLESPSFLSWESIQDIAGVFDIYQNIKPKINMKNLN